MTGTGETKPNYEDQIPLNADMTACPPKIHAEVSSVLPGVDLSKILIVPTCQRSAMDLVKVGEDVDIEKDKLLEQVGKNTGA